MISIINKIIPPLKNIHKCVMFVGNPFYLKGTSALETNWH